MAVEQEVWSRERENKKYGEERKRERESAFTAPRTRSQGGEHSVPHTPVHDCFRGPLLVPQTPSHALLLDPEVLISSVTRQIPSTCSTAHVTIIVPGVIVTSDSPVNVNLVSVTPPGRNDSPLMN